MEDQTAEAAQSQAISQREIREDVIQLAAAFLSANPFQVSQIPDLMAQLMTSVRDVHEGAVAPTITAPDASEAAPVAVENRIPVVAVEDSVQPDFIICLNDGKQFKTLKRHIKSAYDMTPGQYRAYWGLAGDYPMTAPNYAASRSELAKSIGLGRKGTTARTEQAVTKAAKVTARKAKAKAKAGVEFTIETPKFAAGTVDLKDTLTDDGILCLIDGEVTKNLGRHLKTLNVTTEQYRETYNLPETYPFTADEMDAV